MAYGLKACSCHPLSYFLDIRNFAIMQDTALFRPKGTGKFPEFFLRVRGDPNDEIDYKRNMFPTIRSFALIPQILNLNVCFLTKLFFGYSKLFLLCTKPPSSVQTARGNSLNFSSRLEETLMMRLITKEKYVLRFDFLI